MSSSRSRYNEDIGPLDVDPNPPAPSQSNVRGRISSLSPMTAEQFHTIRADYVAKFREWRSGTSGKTPKQMAEILEYMVDDLDHFKTAMTSETRPCFPGKCDGIKHEILQLIPRLNALHTNELGLELEECMAYIGSAIGRLTLEGAMKIKDVQDTDAANETKKFLAAYKEAVFDFPEFGFGPEAEGLRTRLWVVFANCNFSLAKCRCFQCIESWVIRKLGSDGVWQEMYLGR